MFSNFQFPILHFFFLTLYICSGIPVHKEKYERGCSSKDEDGVRDERRSNGNVLNIGATPAVDAVVRGHAGVVRREEFNVAPEAQRGVRSDAV